MKLKYQKKFKKTLKSNFQFDKKQAMKLSKMEYYEAQAKNIAAYEFIEKEKLRLSTPKWEKVTELLESYKKLGDDKWISTPAKILSGIYKKNKDAAQLEKKGYPTDVLNTNLINIISDPQTLLLAYRSIKGNRGAMTRAAEVSTATLNRFNEKQREIYYRSLLFPDKFSLRDVHIVSELIKKGIYPWGSSLRVYVPKPGVPDKMRPITIPPFLDRVVQKAIAMVLEAIYEPYFESQNRSFGFRPNKGTHDAIVAVTSTYSSGKITAIEGDIEAAYDTVNKKILLKILSKKITDRKFLKLIQDRLDYDYVERTEDGLKRSRPPGGIPQGGIDSPYLFNIYMKELDDFVHTEVQNYVNGLNERLQVARSYKKLHNSLKGQRQKTARTMKKVKAQLRTAESKEEVNTLKKELYRVIKENRTIRHQTLSIKAEHPHKRKIHILYVRYADDWILLTNGNKQIAGVMKNMIANFLLNNLELKLSEKKTTITDIRETPAKFLGFELKHPKNGPLGKKRLYSKGKRQYVLRRRAGTIIWVNVDRQKLISRFHMKGFCDKLGFPRELPWLSCMEPQVIVERYNAVMRGLVEFYYGFIRNNSNLQRWIYILRFSCLKTLAQKYKTTVKGVFKKFGVNLTSKSQKTVQIRVRLKVKDVEYEKLWTLHSYSSLMEALRKNDRKREQQEIFWDLEKGNSFEGYIPKKGKIPTVTTEDYLERISWVSLRTQASFAMPCANCGTTEEVQQHHVRHIRKTAYELISKELPYKQVLALRNRKQVPLCEKCHRYLVHSGTYNGTALINLVPTRLVDNRVLHVESFVKPGIEYHAKSLTQKGWRQIQSD